MQYTEDEFLQTLDWRPHAKADFHVCKKQPKELEDETKDILKIEEDQDNEKFKEDTYENNEVEEEQNEQALEDIQTEEFQSEEVKFEQ